MKRPLIKIAIAVILVLYLIVCVLSGFAVTGFHNYGLGFSFLDRQHATGYGLSTYDVSIEPNSLSTGNSQLRFQDIWLQIDNYYKYALPLIPFKSKGAVKLRSEWKAMHLCFKPIEKAGFTSESYLVVSGEHCYNGPRRPGLPIEEGYMQWCYLQPPDANEIRGYLLKDRHDPHSVIPGSEFIVHVPWDKVRKDWDVDNFVWYPGCDESNQSKKVI